MEFPIPTGSPPTLSFGDKLVGNTFNPSRDPRVDELKALSAKMIDIVKADYSSRPNTPIQDLLFQDTLGAILHGQMAAVKSITNEH